LTTEKAGLNIIWVFTEQRVTVHRSRYTWWLNFIQYLLIKGVGDDNWDFSDNFFDWPIL
jgi:nuclear transport factor 2 (NTF2) superfamily protein